MSRDYARQQNTPKRPKREPKSSKSTMPGWIWAVCGLTVGLCVAVVTFIVSRPVEKPSLAIQADAQVSETKAPVATPNIPPRQEARFKFYDLLPKYEIKPSQDTYIVATPKPADPATQAKINYTIQAGSFLAAEDAERRKAMIALIGIESAVKKVAVDGKGTRYRVQIGPSQDYRQVQKTIRQLADNDIDSFATRSDG